MEHALLIEKYFLDTLTADEKRLFEDLLKTDEAFKNEVALGEQLKKVTRSEELLEVKDLLAEFEEEEKTAITTTSIPKKRSTYWLVAASVIILSGLSFLFWPDSSNTADLYNEYFTPYRNVTHSIVRGGEVEKDLKTNTFSAYEEGVYEKAIDGFNKLYTADKDSYYLFYQANALIQLNRAKEAIPLLKQHLKSGDSLSNKTNWFLAMAYLQLNDKAKAIEILKLVVKENDFKYKEAKALLRKLR